MSTQHGLITCDDAMTAGLPPDEIRRLVRSGSWVTVRRGVDMEAAEWEELDPHRGKHWPGRRQPTMRCACPT